MQSNSSLSDDQEALLALLLAEAGLGLDDTDRIPHRAVGEVLPLSFAQQRLWFLHQLEPDNPAYTLPTAIRLEGVLDLPALERSINEVVRRHEVLRTTFVQGDSYPVQVVVPYLEVNVSLIDMTDEIESTVQRMANEEARLPFDLERGPLLRVTLLRLGVEDHVLLITMHHIVSDGWSDGIFLQEIATLYEAFAAARPSSLPELPIQYGDFAVWQRHWLAESGLMEQQLDYWRTQLAGAPSVLILPMDRPRPALSSYRGATHWFSFPAYLADKLRSLGQANGSTLFMTLLAAFQTLLYRFTGQQDILVGSVVANRHRSELESLIGFFANTLVFRTDLSGDPPFRLLLEQVREVALGAYANQDVPFEKLVEVLRPQRDLSYHPLVQVMFALQNTPNSEVHLPGLTMRPLSTDNAASKFDLALSLEESAGGLNGFVEYNCDLFDGETIKRLLDSFECLLEAIVAQPEQRLSALSLLSEAQRLRAIETWNATHTSFPREEGLASLFAVQVQRGPDAVAVRVPALAGGVAQELTYRALDERAGQLAQRLCMIGVGPGVLVSVLMERSLAAVVAILAVVKAGGVYVPLDPTYPTERLAFMVSDSGTMFLLTHPDLHDKLVQGEASVIFLDQDGMLLEEDVSSDGLLSLPMVGGEQLAYMMYTSGSTGRPKGIGIPHRAITRLVLNTNYVNLSTTDVVAHASNISFDAATFEIWGALLHGAQLVVAQKETMLSPVSLAALLRDEAISVLFLTTALFNQLASVGPNVFASLRYLLFGGEAADPRWVREVVVHGAPKHLVHVYGPTESTTFASWYPVVEVPMEAVTVPIGRPVSNTQLHLLDDYLAPVPVGVLGELYIGGAGLARGYTKRPALTAERFIPDPYGPPGTRLYRTGDLGRYRPDGAIEFIGRRDQQVKIRGFRIELGEIEAALGTHPSVREGRVLVQGANGSERLVAYLVSATALPPEPGELRDFLTERLPSFMLPTVYLWLDALPLTPNGKLDRAALPLPETQLLTRGDAFVEPRDAVEFQLARLWEEVLALAPIGVTDNFFDLGGHSLLALQLFARIQRHFDQALPLALLFEGPTVEHLASRLRSRAIVTEWPLLVPIQRAGALPPFFCVHPIGGNVLSYASLARHLGAEQPFFGLQAQGLAAGTTPLLTIEAMAESYIKAIRAVQPCGPYRLGGWSLGGVIAFEMACQLVAQGESVALLALLDSWPPAYVRLSDNKETLTTLLAGFLQDLAGRANPQLDTIAERLLPLEEEAQWDYALTLARTLNLVPPDMRREELSRLLEVFGANARAFLHYEPSYYDGRVTLFRASESESPPTADDPTVGWGALSGKEVQVEQVPGNHYTLLTPPHVAYLAERLRLLLSETTG